MKTAPKAFATFASYLATVMASCPEPYPESFAEYQAGAWIKDGSFTITDQTTMPTRATHLHFWAGFDEERAQS